MSSDIKNEIKIKNEEGRRSSSSIDQIYHLPSKDEKEKEGEEVFQQQTQTKYFLVRYRKQLDKLLVQAKCYEIIKNQEIKSQKEKYEKLNLSEKKEQSDAQEKSEKRIVSKQTSNEIYDSMSLIQKEMGSDIERYKFYSKTTNEQLTKLIKHSKEPVQDAKDEDAAIRKVLKVCEARIEYYNRLERSPDLLMLSKTNEIIKGRAIYQYIKTILLGINEKTLVSFASISPDQQHDLQVQEMDLYFLDTLYDQICSLRKEELSLAAKNQKIIMLLWEYPDLNIICKLLEPFLSEYYEPFKDHIACKNSRSLTLADIVLKNRTKINKAMNKFIALKQIFSKVLELNENTESIQYIKDSLENTETILSVLINEYNRRFDSIINSVKQSKDKMSNTRMQSTTEIQSTKKNEGNEGKEVTQSSNEIVPKKPSPLTFSQVHHQIQNWKLSQTGCDSVDEFFQNYESNLTKEGLLRNDLKVINVMELALNKFENYIVSILALSKKLKTSKEKTLKQEINGNEKLDKNQINGMDSHENSLAVEQYNFRENKDILEALENLKEKEKLLAKQSLKDLEEFKKQKEEELADYKRSVEQERQYRDAFFMTKARMLEDLSELSENNSREDKQCEERLSQIAFSNLLRLNEIGNTSHHILTTLFEKKTIKLQDLQTLIKAIANVTNQGANFVNGTTFKVQIPVTNELWINQNNQISIPDAARVTFYGWPHHGESHNDGTLGTKTIKRCLRAFTAAGITPARIELARQLNLNTRVMSI